MGSNIAPSDICMFSEAGLSDKVQRFNKIIYYINCSNGKEAKRVQSGIKNLDICDNISYCPQERSQKVLVICKVAAEKFTFLDKSAKKLLRLDEQSGFDDLGLLFSQPDVVKQKTIFSTESLEKPLFESTGKINGNLAIGYSDSTIPVKEEPKI